MAACSLTQCQHDRRNATKDAVAETICCAVRTSCFLRLKLYAALTHLTQLVRSGASDALIAGGPFVPLEWHFRTWKGRRHARLFHVGAQCDSTTLPGSNVDKIETLCLNHGSQTTRTQRSVQLCAAARDAPIQYRQRAESPVRRSRSPLSLAVAASAGQ